MYADPPLWQLLLILPLVLASYARDRLTDDPVDNAKEAFAAGEIDRQELKDRLDERNEQIRNAVEQVNGISPRTSLEIAREYESLDGLRASDQERLEGVAGVGEQRPCSSRFGTSSTPHGRVKASGS